MSASREELLPILGRRNAGTPQGTGLGARHLVAFMLFLCLAVAYALRVILSVAIVAMCRDCGDDKDINDDFPAYDWSSKKDTILSSFFWGYVVTQVPGGIVAQRVGGAPLLVASLGLTSAVSLLTPLAADGGWGWMCAGRVVQGLAQGLVFPSVHTLLAKWSPPDERGRLATYVYAGAQVGTIVAMASSGALAASAIGWPSIFYIFGSVGVAWAVLWFFLGGNSPATHRWCSERERTYIEESLGDTSAIVRPPTPWGKIMTSVPMWSLIIVHCGQNWGFWTLLTEMPSYMNSVLGFELSKNGLLSALPYFVMWILSFVFSWTSDFANKKQWLKLTTSRKLFNTIGHWGPACALLGVGYVEEKASAVALLTVAVGLDAATYVGFQVNHIDLSPNFAGSMMGVTNCAANIMSIIGPLLVGVLVPPEEQSNPEAWRVVFFLASGIYFVGNLLFVIFGSAELQPWNTPRETRGNDEEKPTEKSEQDGNENSS
ncbi:hypothetical protein R5R35_004780 [Gryllus longicercus]|uniref:Putative inorganic phosphate cotransporter n=1 Tax=Gryllus longicercus TaxID=2509291 RepID=A0AAN9Z690_9ORTH